MFPSKLEYFQQILKHPLWNLLLIQQSNLKSLKSLDTTHKQTWNTEEDVEVINFIGNKKITPLSLWWHITENAALETVSQGCVRRLITYCLLISNNPTV